jgi:RNA polymerase sigma-70 factor, ECF subfamily
MQNQQDRFIEGLRKGDEQIFEELFKAYYAPMCDYCMRYVPDMDMAEEIVQDLFFKLWLRREEVNINTSIKSYLFTAMRNLALNRISQLKIHDRYHQFVEFQQKTDIDYPTDLMEEQDMERIMKQALATLPPKRREIFEMSRFENLKYTEIAEKLNLSVKTVESQMTRALDQLRKVLEKFLAIILIFIGL